MAKTIYTYDDFLKQATSTGLLQSFSTADLKLAQQNPDAGMTLLTYKQDYRNAASDEARALANAGAEKVRADYGGYSCGDNGADGVFGSGTRAAVRAFQRDHGLTVDGIAGRKTWAALFEALGA